MDLSADVTVTGLKYGMSSRDDPYDWDFLRMDLYFPNGSNVLGFQPNNAYYNADSTLPFIMPPDQVSAIRGVGLHNKKAARFFDIFAEPYKTHVSFLKEQKWFPDFKKLTQTSSSTTMSVFSQELIYDLHRLDAYDYTFAPLAGLLRMEQVDGEPILLGTEAVMRAHMSLTPNSLKVNTRFRRELTSYIDQQVEKKCAFVASARYCTTIDGLLKHMVYETPNTEMKADVTTEFKHQKGYTYHELILFLHNTRRDVLDDYLAQREIDAKLNM